MPTPRKRPPARNGYKYKPQFGIIVMCRDEAEQKRRYEQLSTKGWGLKVVTV